MTIEALTHLAGIVTLIGAVLYTVADILLLAHNVGPRREIPAAAVDFRESARWKRQALLLAHVW